MDATAPPAIKSTCPYCGVGCGVLLRRDGAGGLTVEGDPDHPANYGRLCSKGLALGETLSTEDRLLAPQVHGQLVDWDSALDLVAKRFKDTIAAHGPDSVAFYVSGQLLTEDYYVANKLMKGFIGSANIDTNSRLCMASTVVGHKRAFGTDTVPGTYEDLEEADLVVLIGSNLAWCHPVLYQRLAAARKAHGTKIVVVDPRRTATCDIADLHLKIRIGTDVPLFNGLLRHLAEAGCADEAFIDAHVEGIDASLEAAAEDNPAMTGLSEVDLAAFYALFAETEKVVTVFSQGVNQSTSGADKVNAILNCHLLTGRIGRAGMGPLSATGQPNAMGGRETGGLANMLAAHLDLENADHRSAVQTFWDAPKLATAPGLKAIDMFKAVGEGRIKALWIACTNPVVSLPEADGVAEAIQNCDFTVVSDLTTATDTARLADVVLPALGWGEKDGTVTNSDRTISRQRRAVSAPGDAKADWEIFAEVGRRMGWTEAFDYRNAAEIFREHAALSKVAGSLGKDFDISGLSDLSDRDFDALNPVRWPVSEQKIGGRFFANGQFFTASGRGRMISVTYREPATKTGPRYPYRLNTGRVRDQWHTMTRTAKAPRLNRHLGEPYLQIHSQDAADLGLNPADLALVTSPSGRAILRVLISDDVAPGTPFAPMHWTGENAPASRIGSVVAAELDPYSGQPESKASVVSILPYNATWYGFAVSTKTFRPTSGYWAKSLTDTGWRAELADQAKQDDLTIYAQRLFGLSYEPKVFFDDAKGQTRLAFFDDDRLVAALFVAPEPVVVARDFVAGLLGTDATDILAARPGADLPDPGPIVCACMSVGRNQILAAAAELGAGDVDAVCEATRAGTNCGSCRPEVADLIARLQFKEAAE